VPPSVFRRSVLGLFACSLGAVSLLAAPLSAADASPPVVLRVSSSPDDDATPVLWAEKTGLFRQAGLDVTITPAGNGATVTAAVMVGALEIGKSSMLPIVLAHARGLPLTIVAPGGLHLSPIESGILVPRDSPIRNAHDLEGKIVSVPALNDLQWLSAHAWIDQNGGNSKNVQFVEEPGSSVGVALDAGRIAAGTLANPIYGQDMATGRYRTLGQPVDAIGKRFMISAWFANVNFVAKNPDAVRKFGEIMVRAEAYVAAHHDETVDLIAKFSGVEPATIRAQPRSAYATSLDPALVQPMIDTAARYGSIPSRFDAAELISSSAYRK
jgi:NitT/TauT family transport system substrate-binding protein